IVTGGGAGIGRAVCQVLAKEKASVIVADRDLNGAKETVNLLNSSNDQQHQAMEVDVSKIDSVRSMFDTVPKIFGTDSIATLITNCAGITRDGWMIEMKDEDFTAVIDVNLKGTFYVTQIACRIMKEMKRMQSGSIVNVGSISGKIGNMGQINYAASKSGIEGLTRTAAREMGRYNIRCNAVVPGFIETNMIDTVPENVMAGLLYLTPMGRIGKPEEVAEAIKFLLSDQSSYITGATLQISGGLFM
ncbi:short-chain alcohol dehydrogenase-like protein, partial [Sarcoptes scabiei]